LRSSHFSSLSHHSGNFDVLDDDLSAAPISARLEAMGGTGVLWTSSPGESEQLFEVHTDSSLEYKFCLENGVRLQGDGLDRHVGWALRLRHPERSLPQDEQGPDTARALALVDLAADLSSEWASLLDHYGYLRSREFAHRILSEEIMSRVVRWTVVEGMVLLLIALGQILYLRKFFERRRYL
jgi:hypothetical protein